MTRRYLISILFTTVLLWSPAQRSVRADQSNEYKVKAALIFKFLQFVEWPGDSAPAGASAPADRGAIVIATVGKDPFEGALEQTVAGKLVAGKHLLVRHFANAGEVEKCQVLFVSSRAGAEFAGALSKAGPVGLLTVGETEQFLDEGGIIRIFEQDGKLRFEISQDAAARARIQISAKLLRLAKLR
jgi:uncharacterized protein DUF4154